MASNNYLTDALNRISRHIETGENPYILSNGTLDNQTLAEDMGAILMEHNARKRNAKESQGMAKTIGNLAKDCGLDEKSFELFWDTEMLPVFEARWASMGEKRMKNNLNGLKSAAKRVLKGEKVQEDFLRVQLPERAHRANIVRSIVEGGGRGKQDKKYAVYYNLSPKDAYQEIINACNAEIERIEGEQLAESMA